MFDFSFNIDSLLDRDRTPFFAGKKPAEGYCYKLVDILHDDALLSLKVLNSFTQNGTQKKVREFLVDYNLLGGAISREFADLFRQSVQDWVNLIDLDIHECIGNERPSLYFASSYYTYIIPNLNLVSNGVILKIDNDKKARIVIIEMGWYDHSLDKTKAVIAHELGHFLGLSHPGAKSIPFPIDYNYQIYTIMSYETYGGANGANIEPLVPMVLDILAAQKIHGANKNHNNNDNIYKFEFGQRLVQTIWDGGGVDLIDLSNSLTDVVVDLREGPKFMSIISKENTFFIAYGANVENVNTGSGGDIINGNDLPNIISPGSGKNIATGNGGEDTFVFYPQDRGQCQITDFIEGEDRLLFEGLTIIERVQIEQGLAITLDSGYKIILTGINSLEGY